uniref:N-terminal EF-hand calcium binding protein 1 n=1 Tax=Eptatretus burgeri TaxID=7764 RepID=A0A8C4R172_EPTBU
DVLCAEEMADLFQEIDTHHTDNLDIDELCGYFSWHLGRFSDVFSALEDLNTTLLQAMDSTKRASGIQQFVTRFLLRETSNQVNSFQASLLCATDAIHAAQTIGGESRQNATILCVTNHKHMAPSPPPPKGKGTHILLVQRQISTLDDKLEGFQEVIQDYTKHTNRHVSFVDYEFVNNFCSHLKSQENTSFQRGTAELLDSPEIISSMMVPSKEYAMFNGFMRYFFRKQDKKILFDVPI